MESTSKASYSHKTFEFLSGGGEMGELIRKHDWTTSAVGPIESWPQSLRTTLSIILNSKFPMFLWWGNELTQFYNDNYRPSFGIEGEGKHPKALGQRGEECWPEIWPIIKPLIDQVFAGGEATWSEDQLIPIYRNGKLEDVYWTFSYRPVKNESGKIAGVLVVCNETTEKVLVQNQLSFAIEAAELSTWDYNPLTHKFKGNDRLKNWFGLPADAKIDLTLAINVMLETDRERVTKSIERALQHESGGFYDTEYIIINPVTKQERIVRAKGRAWFNDEKIAYRFNGTLQDVTKDVNARKKLEEEKERTNLAITAGELGVFEVDLLTNVIMPDKRFNEIFGFDETVSREEYAATCHPNDVPIRAKALKDCLVTGSYDYESRFLYKNEAYHWIKTKGLIIYDDNNNPYRLIGVIQDITQQKSFSEELTKQVNERTQELQRSNEDLLRFAHVASHDLKEPVRKIITFNQRLLDEFETSIPEKGITYIEKIQSASNRMLTMIEGVLTYSMLGASEQVKEIIDLNEVIKHIETDLEIAIHQKNGSVTKDKLPTIEGTPVLIYQLFYNLINNSIKFSKPDQAPVIKINSEIEKTNNMDFAKITITDNGIGIEEDHVSKIFDAFTRLNSKDKYEGTGLGLALCKKIVERHLGDIRATGIKDKGAIFTVLLPLKHTQTI